MKKKYQLELVWWAFTAVVVAMVMLPMWRKAGLGTPYQVANIIAIVVFVSFFRLIFVLRHTLISHHSMGKMLVLLLCIPLFVYLMDSLNSFQTFIDERGFEALLPDHDDEQSFEITKYMKLEYVFFVVAAMITTILVPIRMIVSEWRMRKYGTV